MDNETLYSIRLQALRLKETGLTNLSDLSDGRKLRSFQNNVGALTEKERQNREAAILRSIERGPLRLCNISEASRVPARSALTLLKQMADAGRVSVIKTHRGNFYALPSYVPRKRDLPSKGDREKLVFRAICRGHTTAKKISAALKMGRHIVGNTLRALVRSGKVGRVMQGSAFVYHPIVENRGG